MEPGSSLSLFGVCGGEYLVYNKNPINYKKKEDKLG
jgi:hypothetical protein